MIWFSKGFSFYVYVYVHSSIQPAEPEGVTSVGVGVTDGCNLLTVAAEDQTQVLSESSTNDPERPLGLSSSLL